MASLNVQLNKGHRITFMLFLALNVTVAMNGVNGSNIPLAGLISNSLLNTGSTLSANTMLQKHLIIKIAILPFSEIYNNKYPYIQKL